VKPIIVISDRDNVATALEPLEPGQRIEVRGSAVTTAEAIPRGHKMALASIAAGEPVVKYGSPIGIATEAVCAGAHVHTHNLSSNRGRGDLGAGHAVPEARLAEPPDDEGGRTPAAPAMQE
jgi:altronate dehydratase